MKSSYVQQLTLYNKRYKLRNLLFHLSKDKKAIIGGLGTNNILVTMTNYAAFMFPWNCKSLHYL